MNKKFVSLVIEGNQEKMYNIENIVLGFDMEVIKVRTGEAALVCIYNENIDLVLFDADINDIDSLTILETILTYERTYDIPLMLITEKNPDDIFIIKAYELGIADYVRKPINYEILKCKIHAIMEMIKRRKNFERKHLLYKKRIEELEDELEYLSKEKTNVEIDVNIDALTNIPNRRMFNQILNEEWFREMRNYDHLSVFMMDIDYFKQYNDKYGHVAGDECLKKVAKIIDESFNRVGDFVARYGGEEFVAIIPSFEYDDAKIMAEKVRKSIREAEIPHEDSKISNFLTISIGVASIVPSAKYSPTFLVEEADSALYLAKKSGRNIVKGIEI
ncbi:diguanylate cyclase [Clostridiaceae bacterium HSG29]|nr:diguanylate cyclase [Clostridiaceae bacterium HSG29]